MRHDKEQQKSPAKSPDNTEAEGMPAKDSSIEVKPFTSPKGKQYRILKTDETDAYDQPQPSEPHTSAPEPGTS